MKAPPFVKVIKDIWTLAGDNSITVEIEKAGTLLWDKTFSKVVSAAQTRPHGAVLDIGAYIGDSTRWFTEHGFPTLAFEAQRDAVLCLMRNCPEAMIFNLPVGNGERVYLPGYSEGNLGARSVEASTDNPAAGTPTIRIDDLEIEDVCLIKLDVEGYEPKVLDGAAKTIERCRPLIVVEINPAALNEHGFRPSDILDRFRGWSQTEIFRYYEANWDILLTPP